MYQGLSSLALRVVIICRTSVTQPCSMSSDHDASDVTPRGYCIKFFSRWHILQVSPVVSAGLVSRRNLLVPEEYADSWMGPP